jgi:protein-tyrosine phosphatase
LSAAAADAHLLDGAKNFRAVKPYKGAFGRCLRENILFRSGELSRLSEEDLSILRSLEIQLVCDMRSQNEQAEYVSRWPDGSTHRHLDLAGRDNANASPEKLFKIIASEPDETGALKAMDFLYRRKPHAHAGNLRQVFDAILAGNSLPLLVHCHAGKDRTGFMVAMLLAAAGVSRIDIIDDYETTARFFPVEAETLQMVDWARRSYGQDITPMAARPMVEARRLYIEAAFGEIDSHFGGVDGYLSEALGLNATDMARYQDLVLE